MTTTEFVRDAQKFIDLLLRYIVPGGTLVLAFGALQETPFKAFQLQGSNELSPWILGLAVAIAGPAVYSIHRSFAHRFVQLATFPLARLFDSASFGEFKTLSALLNTVEDARYAWGQQGAPWLGLYEAWSAQVHFLYCSAWGLFAAVALHVGRSNINLFEHMILLSSTFLVLIASAVVSDFRALAHQCARLATQVKK